MLGVIFDTQIFTFDWKSFTCREFCVFIILVGCWVRGSIDSRQLVVDFAFVHFCHLQQNCFSAS